MTTVLFGFDLSTPHLAAVGVTHNRAVVLDPGEPPAGPRSLEERAAELRGWGWDQHSTEAIESAAEAMLREARGRFVLHADARCEAVLCIPRCAGALARDAVLRGAARASVEVTRVVGPAEALALACDASYEGGVTVAVSADLGHIEVGVFEARGGVMHPHAFREKTVALGDLFVEDVVSWVSFTIDHRHHSRINDAVGVRWLLAAATREALTHARDGAALSIEAPFLRESGGPSVVTATPDVLALAFDDVIERVASTVEEALRAGGLPISRVARLVIAGRQSRIRALGERLANRWGVALTALEPTAAARGAAREAARMHSGLAHDAPPPWVSGSSRPSGLPPSMPPSIPPVSAVPASPSARPPIQTSPPQMPSRPPSMPPHAAPSSTSAPPSPPSSIPPASRSSMPPPSSTPPAPRSSEPPARSREPMATPAPVALAPGESASARLPRAGEFHGVSSFEALFSEAIVRPARADEFARSMSFAALLSQVGMRPHLHGTLTVQLDGESVRIGIDGGAPVLHPAERPRALRCFGWTSGQYEISEARLAGFSMAVHEPMTGLVVAGVRPMVRALDDARCVALLGDRMRMAPVLRADRESRLHRMRLTASEERTVTRAFSPSIDLESHVRAASSTLRLALLLDLFEIVSWVEPEGALRDDPYETLSRRVAQMASQNHFEVLFVHWSASHEEIFAAWKKFQAEYGPVGAWHRVDRDLARSALLRGEAAWAVLSNEASRLRYRHEAYPTINQELLTPLLESRARILDYAGEKEEARDAVRLLREIHGERKDS